MRVADDLFLVALDDRTGRLRLDSSLLGVGLAGGLIAELLLAAAVVVGETGRLQVRPRSVPPDALGHAICELISAEPQHPLPTWVTFLAADAAGKVADRLARGRLITVEQTRGLLRTATVYRPADVTKVAWRPVRLARLLDEQQAAGWPDCVLACLADAIGLAGFVLRDSDSGARAYLEHLHRDLHRAPALAAVVTAVTSTAAAKVIAHHR